MKRSVNTRIIFGFCCAISLVLAVGILSHFTFKQQTSEALLVKHTYKVLNQLEFIQKLLLDMETGRRGFRATNDKRFLAPYTEARGRFTEAMETLTELTIDNQGQQQRIQQLKADIYNVDTLWQNINTDEIYRTDAERLRVTNREKIFMDIIRKDMGGIIDTEQALLARREKENNTAVTRANLAIATGTILILIVVIAMIVVIIGELRNRKKAQKALEDNFRELDEINKITNEKNWLLTGVSSINNSIQDIQDLNALASSCLTAITSYLKLPAAALYLYEEDLKQFQLRATIGLPTQKPLSGFRPGEGLAGHAATNKHISLVTDIPADFWQLQAASGTALPETILYVPLWLEQKLIGLIELCSFTAEAGQQSTLMTEAANAIAMALNAASANEKIYRLLSQVQEQKEELEAQQEELRQSNEELLRQSEVLQASEEELRVQGEELRQVNLEMERKNDAIEASRQALTIKARELEQSSRYKSEFLANMSHELRTPLNSVLILAKLLSDNKTGNLNAKQTEYAQIIHKSGTDLLNLINDILDLSKIEAGKIDMLFEEVPFNDIAGDLKQLFRVVADEKKINFSVNLGTDLPAAIHTDKQRLEQIIKNLLSNAFKFTPKHGNIEVSFFKQSAQRCGIAVKDSGIGIPADKQQVIFEAFRQADGTTNRKYGGTGLGLSISKELVRKLGGELQLSSVPDKGSTFSIYLPFHYEGNAAEETLAPPVTIAAPVTELQYQSPEHITLQEEVADDRDLIQKGDPVILIVEDDKHFAAIVRDFARSKHYKTVVALQGDEGLYYVHHYRPAAIILDLHLPVVDGKTILQTLKNTAGLSGIPVHVISSEDTTKSELVHARHFIRKPVAEADLEAMFLDINGLIRLQFKKILVISDEHLLNGQILNALGNERHPGIGYDHITGYNNFRKQQGLDAYDCVILDIRTDIGGGISCLQSIRELMGNTIPVIAFLETDISTTEETQLSKYANTVIRNTRMAGDRLLDEMELFLYKIGEVKQQPLSRMPVSGSDKSLKGKKVLLADDDMRNVFALSSMLEDEEMEIVTAADGREALEQLRNNPDTDIVLMDIMMPEMDGYEAMEQIRADKTFRSSLPVIALTAKAMEQDREKCIRHGASDYITKPVDNEKLLSLMRVWLAE